MDKKLEEFLRESNKIENVYDEDSLKQAVLAWKYLKKFKKITRDAIWGTHAILMKDQDLQENEKGQYRQIQVMIGGYEAKPWYAVPDLMFNWMKRANMTLRQAKELELDDEAKIDAIKSDHVAFEKIHPFVDGNGRVGRILWQWQRLAIGLPIGVIYADERHDYYDWFDRRISK